MPHYKILDGTFRDVDNKTKGVGESIELSADFAALHPEKLERLEDQPADAPSAAPTDPDHPYA